ncbi:NAD(P)-binding domain-containing protein [Micromonospora sp. NPDC048170]|uniref:NAD(P)-dependent oxidoreductase n=1 Tax=Micromonospora sp. NPDC048170 TaxID=3154819 RepID=UPI00340A63A4
MSAPRDRPVSVLGLGAMGRALAGALLAAGHPTTVWNRSPGPAVALAEAGADVAGSAAEATAAGELVVVCLLDDDVTRRVLEQAAPGLAGRTVVNLTNGTPEQARRLARWLVAQGARPVDGGIMAVPSMIGEPGAFVLYSGAQDAFLDWRDVLASFGDAHWLGTDPGQAAVHDLALLAAMYGMFGGFLHATAMIRAAGGPAGGFAPMATGWLTAMLGELPALAAAVDSGEHDADGSSLRMQAASFGNLLTASRDMGVDGGLMRPIRDLLDEAVARGHGDDGLSALVGLLRGGLVRPA